VSHLRNPRFLQVLRTKSAATSLIRAAAGFEEKSAAGRQQVLLQSVLLQVLRTNRKG
jgi:hypothetical protein